MVMTWMRWQYKFYLLAQYFKWFSNKTKLVKVNWMQSFQSLLRTNGWMYNRSPWVFYVKINSKCRKWCKDVREDNDSIRPESFPRLQRNFHNEVSCLWPLSEGWIFLSKLSVNSHVPSCLSHHPCWRTTNRISPGGLNQ